MNADLSTRTATVFLTVDEQRDLIARAQDVPMSVTVEVDDHGDDVEVARYGTTPDADAAMSDLVTAFNPLINKIARRTAVQDFDDAYGALVVEFVEAVRRFDLTSDVPFAAIIPTVLRFELSYSDRTSDLIVVKENVAARYHRLMHKHDGDVSAAYAECAETSNGFSPVTFLAVHRIIGSGEGVHSIDAVTGDDATEPAFTPVDPSPSAEDIVVTRDLVDYLLRQVTDRQSQVQRLWHGFTDGNTERLAIEAGLRPGDVLTESQIAEAMSMSRGTVVKDKRESLITLRAVYTALIAEAEQA